jgi:ferritin-like metal-binding protein YciE
MEMNSIEALLVEQLRDLYSAEGQLLKALPKMARKASDPTLREAFEAHTEETQVHVERLQEIGEALGIKLGGHKCKAMEGLVEEGSEVLEMEGDDAVIDAALIAAAQRVEHYEISAYGTARTLAERVGEQQLAESLQQTLDEEYATDDKLTEICEGELLANAPMRSGKNGEGRETGSNSRSDAESGDGENGQGSTRGKARGARGNSRTSSGGSRSSSSRTASGSGRTVTGRSGSSSSRGTSARSGSRTAGSSARGTSKSGGNRMSGASRGSSGTAARARGSR